MSLSKEKQNEDGMKNLFNKHTVDRFMSTNILVGKEDFSVNHIARLFNEMKIHHLPIVNKQSEVVGIITANDMVRIWSSLLEEGSADINKGGHIKDYMTRNPVCCKPDTTLAEAVKLFKSGRFHSLPVMNDEELVGIFTANDLIQFLMEFLEQ